jgi:hypothetical protein
VVELGKVGNEIRSFLKSDFAKDLFEQYWLGKGDYWLSKKEFENVVLAAEKAGAKNIPGTVVVIHGHEYIQKIISFYGSERYAKAFGTATMIYTKQGNAVGFFDTYDFDYRWGQRTIGAELQTDAVNLASHYAGNASVYRIFYNMGVSYSQKEK